MHGRAEYLTSTVKPEVSYRIYCQKNQWCFFYALRQLTELQLQTDTITALSVCFSFDVDTVFSVTYCINQLSATPSECNNRFYKCMSTWSLSIKALLNTEMSSGNLPLNLIMLVNILKCLKCKLQGVLGWCTGFRGLDLTLLLPVLQSCNTSFEISVTPLLSPRLRSRKCSMDRNKDGGATKFYCRVTICHSKMSNWKTFSDSLFRYSCVYVCVFEMVISSNILSIREKNYFFS